MQIKLKIQGHREALTFTIIPDTITSHYAPLPVIIDLSSKQLPVIDIGRQHNVTQHTGGSSGRKPEATESDLKLDFGFIHLTAAKFPSQ